MSRRRVVVTGMGMVTPLGLTVKDTWNAVLQGRTGVSEITKLDVASCATRIGALVRDFDPSLYMEYKECRKTEVFIQYAVAAVAEAMADAGLTVTSENAERIGVSVGAGIGGLSSIENNYHAYLEGGYRRISPNFIPYAIINMAPGFIAMKYGLQGPNLSIVTACGTGAHNLGNAARLIKYGDADVMVAGGTEMATTYLGVGGFAAVRALSRRNDDPAKASRPWDKDRDGFVLGEGAGIMILEEYEHAKKRGAHIYAELTGFGMSCDAYHVTAPEPQGKGMVLAMQNALSDAALFPAWVHYINAHATSTVPGDIAEVLAIKEVFACPVAISSTKSMTGHLLGAAGAVEAIFTVLAIRDQIAPPTINLDHPDEGCDLDFVPHTARKMSIEAAMSNSFGFGGTNASLIFSKL